MMTSRTKLENNMSLRKVGATGAKWTATSSIVITTLQFVQLAVLARLLGPDAFGLMAMTMVVVGFGQLYADMGLGEAIIYHQDTTSEQLSSLYWLNIFAGIGIFFLVIVSIPLIVIFYGEPRLENLLYWTALVFLITPLGQQFQFLLQKNLRFKSLATIEMISAVIAATIAIVSALAGQGVYSLIWGLLSNSASKALMLLSIGLMAWRPHWHFSFMHIRTYISFGLYRMGGLSMNYISSRVDQLVIGSLLGSQILGYYNLAWNLVIQPISKINPIITRVAFPLFAKVQTDNERLKKGYFLVLKVLSTINFPLLFGLAAVSPLLIPKLFGEQWLPSIILVQILAFVAVFRSIGNPIGSLLLAKGRADLSFKWNMGILFISVPGVYLGCKFGGVTGVAFVLLGLQMFYFSLAYPLLIRKLVGTCLKNYIMSIASALILSLVMVLIITLFPLFIQQSQEALLITQILVGVLVYLVLNLIFERQQLQELKMLILGR
jgi:O-antigen/teichoic acid export membrane protein